MTGPRRHLRVVDTAEPTVDELKDQVRELSARIALAMGLVNHRMCPACMKTAHLAVKALNGASIEELKEEDARK